MEWYGRAVEQGLASAQFNLGLMYEQGRGVKQDYARAAELYRRAAEQGDADSQCNLGFLYRKGWGVAPDDTEATKWYRKTTELTRLPLVQTPIRDKNISLP